ncbi:methyltransferase domain-containing protein [Aestuariispira insulae]|uniref:Trans-aconitate 2-methyltransferase n=1 Tax=Aestuariispira insulae TaxID=1461337 RepID=A0A3D9HK88_9PROT|nr:methyltransferase domain-containing protein [Aestuariispira insulae]RED49835.1 trans-aconitate 2-methyltransferase [Aestuariispira insulae]
MSWDPSQYLSFSDHRLRPALDLLARIPLTAPQSIIDLGCGPGNVTPYLARRWPDAQITGIDSSPEMLDRARASLPYLTWREADAGQWRAAQPVDLIFSNACLHWLPDHARLFPALMDNLKPGGVLAIQIPRNFSRPTHSLVLGAAEQAGVTEQLTGLFAPPPTQEPQFYYDCLAPVSTGLEIWESDYLQVLEGDNPVADWTKGTWLRPFLAALEEPDKSRFEESYRALIKKAYPKQGDGKTLLPFLRLFLVATK